MERVGSSSPPQTWEEAYELLERLVDEAAKRRLFAWDRTTEEVQSSIVALLQVDDELAEIAARLQDGPPEFLDIILASPEDLRREARFDELLSDVIPDDDSSADTREAAVNQILAAHPELLPDRGLEYENRLLLVQGSIRRWGAGEEEHHQEPSRRNTYLLALVELIAGCAAWVVGRRRRR